jgi:acyl-CoA synthetase (AMP-forming)/AMP-acid ligase II
MNSPGITLALRRVAKMNPFRTATVFENRTRTWGEIADRVAAFAGALHDVGMKRGDRIAILALNSDTYVELYYAIWWAGGVVVPLNIRWSDKENNYGLKDSACRFLILDDNFLPRKDAITAGVDGLEHLIYIGTEKVPEGFLDYETLIKKGKKIEDARCGGHDLAAIVYTGGTTGDPKGVMLSHGGLWAGNIINGFELGLNKDSIYLLVTPLFHTLGLLVVMWGVHYNMKVVIQKSFIPQPTIEAIEKYKVTNVVLAPIMVDFVTQAYNQLKKQKHYDLSSLKQILYGGSAFSPDKLKQAMEAFPQASFVGAYGQTEASPIVSLLPSADHVTEGPKVHLLKSVGKFSLALEVAIVDPAGCELERGKIGEIKFRGPNTMLGYWNKPKETEATLVDGWVMTGDAGYIDQDGYLYISDRVKDMIVTGGENVYSIEVERAILSHPAVAECVVIGVPDERWGETVHAIVILKPDAKISEAEIITHCRGSIAGYKCPKSVEFRTTPFPVNAAGKILKRELRKESSGRSTGKA